MEREEGQDPIATPAAFDTVAVIGNGIIGHGVSQVYAVAGKNVVLIGRSSESLDRAIGNIRASLADFERHGLVTAVEAEAAVARIRTSTDIGDAAPAQFVIEAVTHDMSLKVQLFGELDGICPPPTVLATSSGAPASEVLEHVRHRERVIATHFWYPPQLIPLVEVCASPATAPEVLRWTCEAVRACGKEPAVIEREIPGFIGNRLQFALLREAWSLWASGAASAEAIDACVRTSIGRRLGITGPIESADIGGIATMESFARGLLPHLDRSAEPPPAVSERIARGGVYDWSRRDADLLRAARTEELFRWLAVDSSSRDSQSEIDTVHPARTAGVKAIVYGVGAMGSIMARLMLEKGVEIVGAIAQSPEKVGRDLGDVAQLGFKTGVTVESDARAALAERGADIAVVALGSHLHAMYPHFERCLEHGVNVVTIEEESFYPWFSAPALAAKLDRIGKEHGATITGSGQQDIYWMSMVSLLMGAAHRVDRVDGRTTWNADDYGPTVAREVHLDETPEEFEAFLAEQGWTSFVVQNTLDALVADLGLTKMHSTSSFVAIVAEADTFSRNLGRPILAGRVLGVVDSARVETEQGTTLTFAMEGRVYGAGEVDVNEWVVRGEPEALRLFNDRVPTRMTTCTQVVNRIPDVINAPPGFVTVDMLPRLAYRPHRLDQYVS